MYEFLKNHWVAGAALMSCALLALVPLLWDAWPLGLLLIFLHSPGYMIHQVEEHTGDRFRTFTNQVVFGGREALTTFDVIWVNAGAVWGLNLSALYIGRFVELGCALAAPYLMLVNAIGHIASGVRYRRYNPGLATSVFIFLPLSLVTLRTVPATPTQQAAGLASAIALHMVIAVIALRRAAKVKPA